MRTIKFNFLILILLIITLGCKDEFLLETKSYKPIMVIDGLISNEAEPYTIKVSKSSPINTIEFFPYEDCIVSIYENTDNPEVLTETEPGIYVTSEGGIQGVVGNKYSISILTPEGEEYRSDLQEMKEPVGIESVHSKLIDVINEEYPDGLPGMQFYVDTETPSNHDNYFLWEAEESFEYNVDFILWDIYFGRPELDTNILLRYPIVENYRINLFRCWTTQKINSVFTGKTTNLITPKITNQPIHFVGTDSKKLQVRYSMLLKQYTIGEQAYYFWKSIEDQISEENFLVACQPSNVTGNIKNVNNPDEIVFGFFTTASVAQKRIFVDRPKDVNFYYEKCFLNTDDNSIDFCYKEETPPFYLVEWFNNHRFGILDFEYCINCTLNGGSNIKPDFWIDK